MFKNKFSEQRYFLRITVAFSFITVISSYILLYGIYRINYMDTAWTLSFAWNYLRHGIRSDIVFRPPENTVTLLFGRTMHVFYGNILDITGWSRNNTTLISTFFIFLSAVIWYSILRNMGKTHLFASAFAAVFLMMRKTLISAHLGRPEAMTLFVISLALLLFIKKKFFLSFFLCTVAVEIHSIGITGFFYIIPTAFFMRKKLFFPKKDLKNTLIKAGMGIFAGILYYLAFHFRDLSMQSLSYIFDNSHSFNGYKAPFHGYLHRHFYNYSVEFVLLSVLTSVFFIFRLYRKMVFPSLIFASIALSSLIIGRPNGFYAVMAMPALVFFLLSISESLKAEVFLLIAVVLVFSTHVYEHYKTFRGYNSTKLTEKTKEAMPEDKIPVTALSDFWFTFRDASERRFIPVSRQNDYKKNFPEEIYFIKTDFWEKRKHSYRKLKTFLDENYEKKLIFSSTEFKNNKFEIIHCRKNRINLNN
ncbi:MAG: hypothetical protein R6W70_04585 [bacterium]